MKKAVPIEVNGAYPYFTYGSNMDLEQMSERLGGRWEGLGRKGILRGHKLAFNKYSVKRNYNVANIVETGKDEDVVEGVVFYLTNDKLKKLDKLEGGYTRHIRTLEGNFLVYTYIANTPVPEDNPPMVEYVKLLLSGKKNGFLSETYAEKLLETDVKDEGKGGKLRNYVRAEDYAPRASTRLSNSPIFTQQRNPSAPVQPTAAAPQQSIPQAHRNPYRNPDAKINESACKDPQAYLADCVQHFKQKGILMAIAKGAILTPPMLELLKDPDNQAKNPKTTAAMRPFLEHPDLLDNPQGYLEICIRDGKQKGALKAIERGAVLTQQMVNVLTDSNYQRQHPKTTEAMKGFVEKFVVNNANRNTYGK